MAERRLAAIMFTDIVGYTTLMAESEQRGRRVRQRHRAVLGPLAEQHHGQILDENGDELVLSFPSALDAVNCALAASLMVLLATPGELLIRQAARKEGLDLKALGRREERRRSRRARSRR